MTKRDDNGDEQGGEKVPGGRVDPAAQSTPNGATARNSVSSALAAFAGAVKPLARPKVLALLMVTYAVAVAAGYAAAAIHMPLPWMLGPFFVCAAVTLAGFKLALVPFGRELGQMTVGAAVGMRFTSEVLIATAALLPAMVVGTVYVIICSMLAALVFRRLAAVDSTTAFFATAAGGVADMAVVAAQRGGIASAVAIAHALRVSCTVAIIPFVIAAFGRPGSTFSSLPNAATDAVSITLALVLATATALALKPTPLPNPWIVGPILCGIVLSVSGLLTVAVPDWMIIVAQVLVGAWLGCQFKREIIASLPRAAFAGFVTSVLLVIAAGLGGLVLAATTGLPVTTSFLALAPAAVTEMVITAKVMHLEAEYVTAFHVMRIAVVSTTVLFVFKLYQRLVEMIDGPRI